MNTVHKFPVSQLPAKLRGGFRDDQLVTVTIESDDEVIPGFNRDEIDELMAPAIEQEKRGEGTVCKTPEDFDSFFEGIKRKAVERASVK